MKRLLLTSASLAGAIVAFDAQNALAQSAPVATAAGSSGRVEEVVVTAQRRSENLQKTPVAVTALTSAALEARQLTKVENLSSSVPSLQIEQVTASPSAITIDLRGASETVGGLVTSESPVALYIDDVYQSRLSASNIDLGDLERIEVLRGPQGTLYGRNSMTGAIKFITKQPGSTPWLDAGASYGSFDEKRLQLSAGAPVAPHIGLTFAGVYDDKNGFQYDPALGRHVGGYTSESARISAGLIDTGPLTAVLRGGFTHVYGEGQYFTPSDPTTAAARVPFAQTLQPYPSAAHYVEAETSLTLGYRFSEAFTLRSITAYNDTTDHWTLDFSGGYLGPPGTPSKGFNRVNVADDRQFTQEVQALGDVMDGKLHYIAGFFFFDEHANESIADYVGAGAFGFGFPGTPIQLLPTLFDTKSKSYAGYGQADYKVTSKLTLTAGLRYTDDQKAFIGVIQTGLFNFTYTPTSDTLSSHVLTPKFTAEYQFTPDLQAYATVSRGYRSGGFNGLAVVAPAVFGLPYRPETNWSYEAGSKVEFWDHRARINGAFYYEMLSDLQLTAGTGNGNFPIQNAAKAHVYGLELESSVTPVKNVNLFGTLALTQDGYDQLNPLSAAAIAKATELPLLSKVQLQFGGSWRVEPTWLGGGGVTFTADIDYRNHRYSDATQAFVGLIPRQYHVNASMTYQTPDKHIELGVRARNLTNEHYYFDGLAFAPPVIAGKFPSPPATWMVFVKYHL